MGKSNFLLLLIFAMVLVGGCSGSQPEENSSGTGTIENTGAEDSVVSGGTGVNDGNQGTGSTQPETEPQATAEVLDCSKDYFPCSNIVIDYTVKDCNPWGFPPSCTQTTEGLESISFISDPINYVPGPFTDEEFVVEKFDIILNEPWDLEFLPDDSMFVTTRHGKIIHIDNGSGQLVFELEPKVQFEVGLMGLAIDPDFLTNKHVYIYYTYDHDDSNQGDGKFIRVLNKISRLTFNGVSLENEVVLLDGIQGSEIHSGGRLEFGPDGKLYATTGDAGVPMSSQDLSFLGGKILRLNKDGSVPEDNPFPDNYVYSFGHRNPQGIAWHPLTNELYASEHGPGRYDEINHILPGKNYGWGNYKCDDAMGNDNSDPDEIVIFPIVCTKSWTSAPSGVEFVDDPESPWFGSFFVAELRGKQLRRYEFDGDKVVRDEIFYVSEEPMQISSVGELKELLGNGYFDEIFTTHNGKTIVKEEYTHNQKLGELIESMGKEKFDEMIGLIIHDQRNMSRRLRDVEYHKGSLYVIGDISSLAKITPV